MNNQISIPKLKAILLYFANNTDTKFLGKVKLMKLFYFLDFLHVKKHAIPVTFDNYVKLEHGPIPSAIKNLVDSATDDIDNSVLADTISIETPDGTEMFRVLPRRKFTEKDKMYFSNSELEVLERVSKRFGDKNTQFIEDASHQESPWKYSSFLQSIPYSLASRDDDCFVSEEEIRLATEL